MLLKKIEEITKDVTKKLGLSLYEVELKNTDKGKVLRVYITSPNGIQVDDCSNVSRALSQELDVLDLIAKQYYLEVSSPGIERALKRIEHYEQAIGQQVKVTYRELDKNITEKGILKQVSSEGISLNLGMDKGATEDKILNLPYEKIKKARTVFDYQSIAKE
jgi:ribosome maturation factor RimP